MVGAVTLAYIDRHRRRIRLVTDAGVAFLLDLPRAQHFADGDGLELDTNGYLRVCAAPEPVLEIEALDPTGLEAATDAAAAMVAERCGEGAFETLLQALVVETTR